MVEIILARKVAVEFNSVEEAVESDLVEEVLDAEDKVDKAEVVADAVSVEDIMKERRITLTLNFSVFPKNIYFINLTFVNKKRHNYFTQKQQNTIMALKNFHNQNRHINYIDICVYYKHKQHEGDGNNNQYDDNSSFGGLSIRQVYEMNTLFPLPIGPSLAPPGNENLYGLSKSVDYDQ